MIDYSKCPDYWDYRRLSNVADVDTGYAFRSDNYVDDGIPLVKIGNVGDGFFKSGSFDYLPEKFLKDVKESTKIHGGELLIRMTGSKKIGNVCRVPNDSTQMLLNQRVGMIHNINNDLILTRFLEYWLHSDYFDQFVEQSKRGGAQSNFGLTELRQLDVLAPPLDEQERIVEVVDERLGRVKRLQKSVENVGRLAEEYENSLLSYLLTGRGLIQEEIPESEERFGQIPEDWEIKRLREIGSRISSMTEPESGSTYSLYSFDSVDDGAGYYEVDGDDIGSKKRKLNGGEVMISRLNPRINRVQKVDKKHDYPPIASSEFVAIDIEDYVNREYLYEYLRNPILQERLTNHVTGSTGSRSRVGFDFVMDSKIPVPPKDTQEEIINDIRQVNFDILEKSYSDVSELFDEYRNSVLSHALRGEVGY